MDESDKIIEDEEKEEEEEVQVMSFIEMGIDDRILMAILQLDWNEPTTIQETAIPLILAGRDILAKARTNSSKTSPSSNQVQKGSINLNLNSLQCFHNIFYFNFS
jgi:superfamily II DNA/RNA helicase